MEPKTRYDEMLEQAKEFHYKKPIVWKLFCRFTFDRIEKGFNNYSAKCVMERIRWETDQPEYSDDEFKICNNHTAFYARWFMAKYPMYDGFFRLRQQTSKHDIPTHLPELTPSHFTDA